MAMGAARRTPVGDFSLDELRELPTLSQGQADDLKISTDRFRVWLSRMHGDDFDGVIPHGWPLSFERLVDGTWLPCDADGRPL
jgi:hypothetical protein